MDGIYNNNIKIDSKKVFYFGTGEWVKKTIDYGVPKPDIILDNNELMHGKYMGIPVVSPKKILNNHKDLIIIITTSSYKTAIEQLSEYDLDLNKEIFISPVLKNVFISQNLKKISKRILFTCSDIPEPNSKVSGGGLYEYELKSRSLKKVLSGKFHEIEEYNNKFYIADEFFGVIIVSKNYKILSRIKALKGSTIHGLAIDKKNDLLFVANTGRDSISVIDIESEEIIDEIFIGHNKDGMNDRHHINDMCFYNNELYISMFSLSGLWKNNYYDGGVIQFSYKNKKQNIIKKDLIMPHTITVEDDSIIYMESLPGKLYISHGENEYKFNGFIRGLCRYKNYIFIGQSEHRYFDRYEKNNKLFSINCGIYVLDKKTSAYIFHSLESLMNIHSMILLD